MKDDWGWKAQTEQRLQANPHDPNALLMKAQQLMQERRRQEALEIYEELLESEPSLIVYLNKSTALLGLKRYSEALATAEAATSAFPEEPLAYVQKAYAYQALTEESFEQAQALGWKPIV